MGGTHVRFWQPKGFHGGPEPPKGNDDDDRHHGNDDGYDDDGVPQSHMGVTHVRSWCTFGCQDLTWVTLLNLY